MIVPTMSKILIWKQFTTGDGKAHNAIELFPLCQRYSFESNSQQKSVTMYFDKDCSHYVKDTHLKAIHNFGCAFNKSSKLFPLCQRYSFESNSQRFYRFCETLLIVPTMSKILIWKQFTTVAPITKVWYKLFPLCQRYSFESNSQLVFASICHEFNCSHYVKDTHLKAIHN